MRIKRPAPARWTPALKKLKAISIRQLWAWLIVNGYKDIENRTWATNYRGAILIHAGLTKPDKERLADFEDAFDSPTLSYGGIIGVVDIVDCVQEHRSKWFHGPFGWVLANPRPLPFRPCPGRLMLFHPDI